MYVILNFWPYNPVCILAQLSNGTTTRWKRGSDCRNTSSNESSVHMQADSFLQDQGDPTLLIISPLQLHPAGALSLAAG